MHISSIHANKLVKKTSFKTFVKQQKMAIKSLTIGTYQLTLKNLLGISNSRKFREASNISISSERILL